MVSLCMEPNLMKEYYLIGQKKVVKGIQLYGFKPSRKAGELKFTNKYVGYKFKNLVVYSTDYVNTNELLTNAV